MRDLVYLSFRHAIYHKGRTCILVLCLAVAVYLPVLLNTLTARYETTLSTRAQSTPLLIGAKGNRYDLTLSALYFRQSEMDTLPYAVFEEISRESSGLAVPLNLRFAVQGRPIVATSTEYFDSRALTVARGSRPLRIGDVVLGHAAAVQLGVGPGATLFSDQRRAFEIAESPSLALRVVGVLERSGSPDDNAIFTDIRTAWMLEGAMHGHDDASTTDPRAVYARTEDGVVLNNAVRELNQLTEENAASFHMHGDESELPINAVLFFPATAKDATIAKARVNAGPDAQMLVPEEVIDDLLGFVFRIKAFLDLVAVALAACVLLLMFLVFLLVTRLRASEMKTLSQIGCRRWTPAGLYAIELLMITVAGIVVASAAAVCTLALLPDLVTAL